MLLLRRKAIHCALVRIMKGMIKTITSPRPLKHPAYPVYKAVGIHVTQIYFFDAFALGAFGVCCNSWRFGDTTSASRGLVGIRSSAGLATCGDGSLPSTGLDLSRLNFRRALSCH